MQMILFCGLQGAGKSTFFSTHFAQNYLLISKDLMRGVRRPAQKQSELLHLALAAQHSVIIDNTNPSPDERVPLITIAREYHASVICYYFVTPVSMAIKRNAQREGKARVPAVAIYSTAARLVPPAYAEGFDKIYYVRITEHSTSEKPEWEIEEMPHEQS